MESKNRIVGIVLVGVLLIAAAFFGINYYFAEQELQELRAGQSEMKTNAKVINFASMFVKKVLRAEKEVDFETRLSLENAVRDLEDKEIMDEWQRFVGSKTEAEAQESVKILLDLLISKISTKPALN